MQAPELKRPIAADVYEPDLPLPAGALQTTIAFAHAFGEADVPAALGYFGAGARLLAADGTEVSGPDAIGDALASLLDGRRVEITPGRTIVAGGVAHCTQSWRLVPLDEMADARGTKATLVLHQVDQRWQIVIAAPWG